MRIGLLGISYKSSEIGIRESVLQAAQKRFFRGSELSERYSCVLLSTCNRVEIYFSADNLAEAHSEILGQLRDEIEIPFEHKLYSFFGFDCFLHLSRVTAGLDSAIIAESEIQRQVKVAYEQTLLHYRLPSCMHYLFQKSLKLGKEVRTLFSFAQNQTTIPKTLYQIGQHVLKELTDVLFIGNSEINRKVIGYFRKKGVERITLCTRALHSVEQENIRLLSWDKLEQWKEFPLVVCGSNVPHPIIEQPGENIKTRLIFDLSVPRNVDPCLARHPLLTLLNMEELNQLIEKKQEKNLFELHRAEVLLFEKIQRYTQRDSKVGIWQSQRPEFEPGVADAEVAPVQAQVRCRQVSKSGMLAQPKPTFESRGV